MKKRTKLISIILGVVMITGITSVTVLRLNSISQIEQEHIDEYGDIAEMYYYAFDFPDKQHKKNKILRENGFYRYDTTINNDSRFVVYKKNVIINGENCDFSIEFTYDTVKIDNYSQDLIVFHLSNKNQDTEIRISKYFRGDDYTSNVYIDESIDDEHHSVSIDLINDELIYEEEEADQYIYDNYLNGVYDAEIDEMLSIMDESLK